MNPADFLPQKVDLCTPRTVYGTLSAVAEAGTNIYDFAAATTLRSNDGTLLEAQAGILYLLDTFSFRLDRIDETNYLNSVFSPDPAFASKGVLGLKLYWAGDQQSSQQSIYTLPLVRYADDAGLRIYTLPPSNEGSAALRFDVEGTIASSYWEPALDPLPAFLDVFFSIRLFEIRDTNFISRYNALGIGGVGLCPPEVV